MAYKSKWPMRRPLVFYTLFLFALAALVAVPFFIAMQEAANEPPPAEFIVFEAERPVFTSYVREGPDIILEAYQNPETRELVEDFFELVCGSREIAEVILAYASEFDIPPAMAFSLCWEESRYFPRAVNRRNRNQSIDRGLFQLNNSAFPYLTEADFFDPEINAKYGLSHLRWCLNHAGTDVAGLAMYNAGMGRVGSGETPKTTLDYVSRILNRQRRTEELFLVEYVKPEEEEIVIVEEKPPEFTLSLLAPLGRR